MTKGAAIHGFYSSFGIGAYSASSVPEDVIFPYLTYEFVADAMGQVSTSVNLWYYTESEAIPNAKAQEISEAIGLGGKILRFDGGAVWIKRGSPWCQSLKDDTAPGIKRRLLNVTLEYISAN
jgi:hypothetical protein